MDTAALIFASASLPILLYNLFWYSKERKKEGLYGIGSGIFGFSGALSVTAGFPGNLIMPITFGILSAGAFHSYFEEKSRMKAIKGIILLTIAAGILLAEVFL